jgi:uncharacterized protein YjbI with pentapeptide repeats
MNRNLRLLVWSSGILLLTVASPVLAQVSPRQEVQENFQRLVETNSCRDCDLAGAVLNRVDLSGADLEGANLAGAQLYLATLVGANLKNANLQGAALGGADLAGADLTGTDLTGAVLEGAYLQGVTMDGDIVTRRSSLEEGEPGPGEMVFVRDEESTKEPPYTHTVVMDNPEPAAVEGAGVPEADEGNRAEEQEDDPVAVEGSGTSQPEPAVEVSPGSEGQPLARQAPPKASKKLVMIDEPQVQERLEETGAGQPSAPGEKAEDSFTDEAAEGEPVQSGPPAVDQNDLAAEPALPAEQVADSSDAPAMTGMEREADSSDAPAMTGVEQEARPLVEQRPREKAASPEPPAGESVATGQSSQPEQQAAASEERAAALAEEAHLEAPLAESTSEADPAAERKTFLREKLLDENRCVGCDLSGIDLAGKGLKGADLERADLRGADLHEVNLREANLKGADLRGADLREADLRKADLYRANLNGADLTGARLDEALIDSISASDVIGADFSGAGAGE